ncbi:hypothetical protein FKM82_028017 [Ascaphus truei]
MCISPTSHVFEALQPAGETQTMEFSARNTLLVLDSHQLVKYLSRRCRFPIRGRGVGPGGQADLLDPAIKYIEQINTSKLMIRPMVTE